MDSTRCLPLLAALLVLLLTPPCHEAAQIHVSHGGNDAGQCGASTKKACKTIGRAVALSDANDVIVLDDADDAYVVNTTAAGHLNITHSLTVQPLGTTATVSCADGRAALFHVFDPDHRSTPTPTPAVTLTLAKLKIRDCAGTWRRPDVIRITNGAVRMRHCQLLNAGTIVDWPDRAGRPCQLAKLDLSDTRLTSCGLYKPYVPCVDLTGCDSVQLAVRRSLFLTSAVQLRAGRNLDVQLQQTAFRGQSLRGPSVAMTLASNLSSVLLTDVAVVGHDHGKSSALVLAVEQPVALPTVHFNNVTFANNSFAKTLGGAVGLVGRLDGRPPNVRVQFNGCTFAGNSASQVGGAVYAVRIANVRFTDCVFEQNVGAEGGAVMLAGVRNASFVNGTFVGNRAVGVNDTDKNGLGGAIRALASDLLLSSCRFVDNAAGLLGQSVHISQNGNVQISNCSFVTGVPANDTAIGTQLYLQQVEAVDEPIVLVGNSYEVKRQNSSGGLYYTQAAATLNVKANKVCCPPGQRVSLTLNEPYILAGFHRSAELQFARCRACPPGMYNLLQQCLQTDRKQSQRICFPCPENAHCPGDGMIVAQRNYWGSRADNATNEVTFLPCPVGYCDQANCQGIECCSDGREGVLCGRCRSGSSYDLAAKSCVDDADCRSMPVKIILLAVAFGLLYLMLIALIVGTLHCCLDAPTSFSFPSANVIVGDGDGSTSGRCASRDGDDPLIRVDSDDNSDTFEPSLLLSPPTVSLPDSTSQQVESRINEQTQTSLNVKHESAPDCHPWRGLEFTACALWMLLQLFDDVYKVWYSHQLRSYPITIILDLINLRPVFGIFKRLCISGSMASITEVWLALLSLGTMFTVLMLIFIFQQVVQKAISRVRVMDASQFKPHLTAVLTKLVVVCIIVTYVPLVRCGVHLVYCVRVGAASGEKVAFYNGAIPCNQWWQWLATILMITHVAPVGFLVYHALPLIRMKRVTGLQFMVCLMFPLLAILYLMCKQSMVMCPCLFPGWRHFVSMQSNFYMTDDSSLMPSDIIHSFFTCPFRLQRKHSSSGLDPDAGKGWVMLTFIRALIVVTLSTVLENRMHLSSITVAMVLFMLTMAQVTFQPYRCWSLNCAEAAMLFSLTIVALLNLINSFMYTQGMPSSSHLSSVVSASDWIYVMMMLFAMIGSLAFIGYQAIKFGRSKNYSRHTHTV